MTGQETETGTKDMAAHLSDAQFCRCPLQVTVQPLKHVQLLISGPPVALLLLENKIISIRMKIARV